MGALSFLWNSTRGARLRPWRSPYLLWRIETYSGMHAEEIGAKDVMRFLWQEKWQFLRFLRWTEEIRKESKTPHA
ncbi:hypothetical protein [Terriglobus sp. RCC_193]|uniref:hypothetical protein n=1 Tax=Terriglobus sp. RCC_193 TaxID=3239218 RepID=UPI003525DA2A